MEETISPVEYSGKSLEEVLSPLGEAQRSFLLLRLRGVSGRDALEVVKRKYKTVSNWFYDEPVYRGISEYLLREPERWREEAAKTTSKELEIVEWGLLQVAKKVVEFDDPKLKRGDKLLILKAVEMVRKVHPVGGSGGGEIPKNYDELILKMRRSRDAIEGS